MIKKIEVLSTGKNKYLYENEVKILLNMLNKNVKKMEILNKTFVVNIQKNNTAIVKIYKIQYFIFVKLLTELKIKYS